MTAERLNFLIEQCFRKQRMNGKEAFLKDIACWLGVKPITLRRWLDGKPIPRQVEIIFTILRFFPVTAESVDKLIQAVEDGTMV